MLWSADELGWVVHWEVRKVGALEGVGLSMCELG